ncbi:cysteine hydrolase family protein [Paraburkholderia pallida]|uniref:Cysteine hydrolase n=1 Tax=Paraburkholderia pallida TaxID=2547399 RepID=A0A4P7D314_9BURK|nr:cysteine hydrolase family protein [Paraburkholderia pallida]QBR03086.1 cysteine hydrolase [Paraburkholderia pallida]
MTTALLVIDFQQGLVSVDPLPGSATMVTANINVLIQRAREAGAPVVFIQHEDDELVHGEPAWEIAGDLRVEPQDHRVGKRTPDSFLNTELGSILERHGVKHVVVCGYASEFCVDTTVRRAAANGYAVTLAADAHTTHDKQHASAVMIREHHNQTLSNIRSFGPRIAAVPAETIAFGA